MIDDPEIEKALDVLISNSVSDTEMMQRYRARYGLKAREMINAINDSRVLRQALHQVLSLADQQGSLFHEPTFLFTMYKSLIVHLQYHVPHEDDIHDEPLLLDDRDGAGDNPR
ncbi:MAG: hypothetical protein KJN72_10705 [Woeseia sp.]|nr:hypothetical protein [Woeseia sp.]